MISRRLQRAFACAILFLSSSVLAYETDQLTNRFQDIADSTVVLNREVNFAIAAATSEWDKGEDPEKLVFAIYRRIGGANWVDQLERFAMFSPQVDRIDAPRYDSIYGDMPIWRSRIVYFTGVSKTIKINGQLVGTDKIGHFISQGRKFYKRYREMGSEELAARQSAFTEKAIFGQLLAGAYSNADLVANYEGYRFFRSLFEDDVIPGKPSILRWQNDRWIMQRPFDWSDHVNEYWDEALNPSRYDSLLYSEMVDRFESFCPDYWREPEQFIIANDDVLRARYSHLQMRDSTELRLDSLCPAQAALGGWSATPGGKSSPGAPASP